MSRLRTLARKPPVIAGGVAALALIFVGAFFVTRVRAVPVLQPVYEIETVSNGHTNKLLGLEMGQPGVLQVPAPVDVDGDHLSDVLVSVNLVEVSAALADEPLLDLIDEDDPTNLDPGDLATTLEDVADTIVVPNIQVVRDPTAVAAGRASPPAKIQVKLTVRDVSVNPKPDVVVRFGYDTGNDGTSPKCPDPPLSGPVPECAEAGERGRVGSIPQHFQALVRGLNSPEVFNPLIAEVTTKEGPVVNPFGPRRDTYEGPLDLVASISEDRPLTDGGLAETVDDLFGRNPTLGTALRFGYKPFPGTVRVLFGDGRDVEQDSLGEFAEKPGQHVLYEHSREDEVDLDTRVVMFGQPTDDMVVPRNVIEARVDRLPRQIKLDMLTGDAKGSVDYKARSDGRRPDVSIGVASEVLELKEVESALVDAAVHVVLDADLKAAGIKVSSHAEATATGTVTDTMTIVGEPVEGDVPLFADLDIESLPPDIHLEYDFAPLGEKSARFCAGAFAPDTTKPEKEWCDPNASGIGAVEATVRNFRSSSLLAPFVPESQQFMALQNAALAGGGEESLIRGRVERVRDLSFGESADGFEVAARVGDGEAPLQVHFARDDTRAFSGTGGGGGEPGSPPPPPGPCDDAAGGGGGGGGSTEPPEPGEPTGGTVVAFTSTVVPVPDDVSMLLRQSCPEETTEPLRMVYDSSKSVDVMAKVEVFEEITGVAALPACGQIGSICGDLDVRHIPRHIDVAVSQFPAPVPDLAPPDELLFTETRIDVDAEPFVGGAKPDFFFDARIGQEDETPTTFGDDIPLVAHAELRGFPEFVRIRAREGLDETLDRVEFHACDFRYDETPPACTPETKAGKIDAVSFNLRNWEGERPANLPILVPETPLYATLAGTGAKHLVAGEQTDIVRFEAGAQVTDISEVQYRNTGKIFGLRSRIGANKDMSAKVDLRNIVFQGQTDSITLTGDARVTPIPGEWDFCLRQPHQPIGSLSDAFTDQCEQPPASFGTTSQPLSIGFNANTDFDVEARGRLVAHGPDLASVDDDFRMSGYVKVADLPSVLEAHFDAPKAEEEGPIRFESTSNSSVTVDFEAEAADGDLVCEDPRVAPLGKQSLCARGRIKDLPQKTFFKFDPTEEEGNLLLDTDGGQIDVIGIGGSESAVLSRVASKRKGKEGTPDHDVVIPDVLVAEARLEDLPDMVTGTINLPGTLEVQATPEVGKIDATVRNFIIPDPMPGEEPSRKVRDDLTVGPDDPGLKVLVFGRKDVDTGQLLFKGVAHVEAVRGFAYKTAKDAAGELLDTRLITADFGTDQVIRVYADVDEGTRHIVGDLVLPIPRGMEFCFRGKKETTGVPVAPTFCDQAPSSDDEGAFQFVQRGNEEMDVHAFVRYATGASADVLSARADIVNIPKVVQGTFREGSFDAAGYSDLVNGFGQTPDGIDRISFHAATFDLDDHGYVDGSGDPDPPFGPRVVESGPFPAGPPDKTRQHVGLAATADLFEARGRIGEVEGGLDTVAASDLRRIRFKQGEVCPKPSGYGVRADYPLYPANPDPDDPIWKYTCIRGDFETLGTGPDPLDIDVDIELEGQRLKVKEAGLTDIPEFFQVNMAEGPSTDGNGLRPPCRRPEQSAPNCAPPFLRIDTPGATDLFGFAQFGVESDLQELLERQPYAEAPDFDASPGEFGCGWDPEWGDCDAADLAQRPRGVRAKLGLMEGGGKAIQAGLRLAIPAGVTVDQILSWSESQLSPRYFDASDFRFGYTTADAAGDPVNSLGQAAALIHKFEDGMQVLVGDAFDPEKGLPIPGDLALAMYDRNLKGSGRQLLQIDGRVNVALDIGARVFLADGGVVDGKVLNVPATTGSEAPGEPSFRIRAEIAKDAEKPPTGDEGSSGDDAGGGGEIEEEDDCTPLLCFKKEFALKKVDALFDFAPTGTPARLLEAVLRLGGDKNGAEVIGWSTVTGKKPDGTTAERVNFEANVDVLVQPINVFFHAGIPVIGALDFVLMSDLQAGVAINGNRLMLRHNLMHLRAGVDSSAGLTGDLVDFLDPFLDPPCITTTSCLYVDFRIYHLHGIAFSILGLLWGNPILLGVDFLPPSLPRGILPAPLDPTAVNITFRPCPGLDAFPPPFEARMLSLPSGIDRNVVVWLDDPRLFFYGTLGPLFQGAKFMADLLAPLFCFLPTGDSDIPLIQGSAPGAADRFPGDPLGLGGHPVPDVAVTTVEAPKEKVVVDPFPSLTVKAGEDVALCGDWAFNNVTVEAGGTLRAATSNVSDQLVVDVTVAEEGGTPTTEARPIGPRCHQLGNHPGHQDGDDPPQDNLGRLKITATGTVTVDGTVVGANQPLSLVAGGTLDVRSGATVTGGTGKITLAAGDDLFVSGSVDASQVLTVPPPGAPAASGNSGGGHGGRGGDGGLSGLGGDPFGDEGFDGILDDDTLTEDGQVATEGGAPGSSVNSLAGARGGGAVTLIAGDELWVFTGASVSANGGAGVDGVNACDTGLSGSGGGAGGGMVLSAPRIAGGGTVSARGGDGGDGRSGGGGGAGGRIKLISPLLESALNVDTAGGGGGTKGCASLDNGDAGQDGEEPHDPRPQSSALAFTDGFWQRGRDFPFGSAPVDDELDVRYSASAPGGDSNDFYVVTCGQFIAPDRPELDEIKNATLEAGSDYDGSDSNSFIADGIGTVMQTKMPPPESVTLFHPCGTFGPPFAPFDGFGFGSAFSPLFPFGVPGDPVVLGTRFVEDATRSSATVEATELPTPIANAGDNRLNGFWGVWTIVIKPKNDLGDCILSPGNCFFEQVPRTPDFVFGYDNTLAGFDLGVNVSEQNEAGTAVVTSSRNVLLSLTGQTDTMARQHANPPVPQPPDDGFVDLSGVKEAHCANNPDAGDDFVLCTEDWKLPVEDRANTIRVHLLDQAANVSSKEAKVILDTTAPSSNGQLVVPAGVTELNNGWYDGSPHFRMFGFDDPDSPHDVDPDGYAGFKEYRYRFDDGREHSCAEKDCTIGDDAAEQPFLPGPGRHTFTWYGVDRAGNKEAPRTLAVKIDDESPLTAFSTVATAPNGANDWFVTRTHGAVSTFDRPPGGSGFSIPAAELPGDGSQVGRFYGIAPFPTFPVPTTPFTTPFEIPPGTHRVCWKTIDVAGHTGVIVNDAGVELPGITLGTHTGMHCTGPITVDLNPPDVDIVPAPAAPNGDDGWYVGAEPTVMIQVNEQLPGSGVGNDVDPALCEGGPLRIDPPGAARPSGVCVSIDGGRFGRHDPAVAITVPEGVHNVRAFAVDRSGQQSEVEELLVKVDLSNPVTTPRMRPPFPAVDAGWWRRVPTAVLRATDGEANAGVRDISFSLDGAAGVYTGPFPVAGDSPGHVLDFFARDRSGSANDELVRSVILKVDTTPVIVTAGRPTLANDLGVPTLLPDAPVVWNPLLHGKLRLNWTAECSSFAGAVRARVIVYNLLGQVAAVIEDSVNPEDDTVNGLMETSVIKAGERCNGGRIPPQAEPRTVTGVTEWDGTDNSLLSPDDPLLGLDLVPAGIYWYRVVVEDEAGHDAHSGESHPLQVVVGQEPAPAPALSLSSTEPSSAATTTTVPPVTTTTNLL